VRARQSSTVLLQIVALPASREAWHRAAGGTIDRRVLCRASSSRPIATTSRALARPCSSHASLARLSPAVA
jgi:hypothetical protein